MIRPVIIAIPTATSARPTTTVTFSGRSENEITESIARSRRFLKL